MPTRLLLEGPDIQQLLVRVRDEHGTSARIVSADKVRSGGIGGFFTRERYAVAIEIDEAGPGAEPAAAGAQDAPMSILDLAAAIDAAEVAFASPAATASTVRTAARAAATAAPVAASAAVSTEGPDFASVLAGLARATRPSAVPAPAPAPTPASAPTPALDVRAFVPATLPAVTPRRHHTDTSPAEPPAATPDLTPLRRARHAAGSATALLRDRLVAVGLPYRLVDLVLTDVGDDPEVDARLYAALARAVGTLPAPALPACRPGDIVVVVGEGARAYASARALADSLRLDPAAVLLAAPTALGTGVADDQRINGALEAARRRGALAAADLPTLVAVDLPAGDGSGRWARDIIDALGARTVWALVDATRKPGDASAALDVLGAVDALVVDNARVTRDPGTVLDLAVRRSLPTALVDGRLGDAAAWAAILTSRMVVQR